MTRATFEKVGAPPCLQSVLSFPLLEGIGWIQLPIGPGPLWTLGDGKTGISQHCINILHLRSDCWVLEPRMFIPCLSSMQCILHTCLIRRVTNGEAGLSTVHFTKRLDPSRSLQRCQECGVPCTFWKHCSQVQTYPNWPLCSMPMKGNRILY